MDDFEDEAEYFIAWCNATLDAGRQWEKPNVDPRTAAMLLCGQDPLDPSANTETTTTAKWISSDGKTDVTKRDYDILLDCFKSQPTSEDTHRSLREWRDIARNKELKYHSWSDRFIAAMGLVKKQKKVSAVSTMEKALPPGVDTREIVSKFKLSTTLEGRLKHINTRPSTELQNALLRPGRRKSADGPALSHLWNPVEIAKYLMAKEEKKWLQMDAIIRNHFLVWLDVWGEYESPQIDDYQD